MAQDRTQGKPLMLSVFNLEFCYQIQSRHDMALLSAAHNLWRYIEGGGKSK
jgi:hypothetical protein